MDPLTLTLTLFLGGGVTDTDTDTYTLYFFHRGGDEAEQINAGHKGFFISFLTLTLTLTLF